MRRRSAALVIGIFFLFGALQVNAEVPSIGRSDATITFIEGEQTPPMVVDPENPLAPFDPEIPGSPQDPPTGNFGPLSLDYVSSLDFGVNPISSNATVYEATTLRPFLQVTDNRGTGAGWTVVAQMSGFTHDAIPSLPGAVVTLTNGEVITAGTSAAPISSSRVVLHAGGAAAQVVSAPVNTGRGTWVNRWLPDVSTGRNDNVTLEIPGAAATIGDHVASITWTLTDAPGQ